jgi:hypothetical protein
MNGEDEYEMMGIGSWEYVVWIGHCCIALL